jgi:hypothetical protein
MKLRIQCFVYTKLPKSSPSSQSPSQIRHPGLYQVHTIPNPCPAVSLHYNSASVSISSENLSVTVMRSSVVVAVHICRLHMPSVNMRLRQNLAFEPQRYIRYICRSRLYTLSSRQATSPIRNSIYSSMRVYRADTQHRCTENKLARYLSPVLRWRGTVAEKSDDTKSPMS